MVTEDEYMLVLVWALAFTALNLFLLLRNRRLKRKLRVATATASLPAMIKQAPTQVPETRDDEVAELRKRIQVLERITVDHETSLSREIEALRVR